MPNLRSRNPGETPPAPTRNFSHPNRQRASSLSPERDRDNPAPTLNDSRYMLPILPSRILPRSPSTQSLQTEQDRHADFDFGYESPLRPVTAYTTFSTRSVPDLGATALPQMPNLEAPPVPWLPPWYAASSSAPPAVTIIPPSPHRSIRRPPLSPTKSTKSGKGSRWGRWSMRAKTAFRFRRHKQPPVVPPVLYENEPTAPTIDISGPSTFRHLNSCTVQDLRAPETGLFVSTHWRPPIHTGAEQMSVMIGGGLGISSLGQPLSLSQSRGALPDVCDAGPSGESSFAGLGCQDEDGSAVSDDGDSEWEDSQEMRVFLEYHKKRRSTRYSFTPR